MNKRRSNNGFGHEKPNEGGTNDWITPEWLISALGGPHWFDLDPCASLSQPWPCAKNQLTVKQNGLAHDWYGNVWLNPPYGPHAARWVKLLAEHGTGIALIFARTETALWQDHIFPTADGILFPRRRITFHMPDGSLPKWTGGAPSALIAWGQENRDLLVRCVLSDAIPGHFLPKAVGIGATDCWVKYVHSN